jgi:hypothetical protein
MMDDEQLLHAYARERRESDFGELVTRLRLASARQEAEMRTTATRHGNRGIDGIRGRQTSIVVRSGRMIEGSQQVKPMGDSD